MIRLVSYTETSSEEDENSFNQNTPKTDNNAKIEKVFFSENEKDDDDCAESSRLMPSISAYDHRSRSSINNYNVFHETSVSCRCPDASKNLDQDLDQTYSKSDKTIRRTDDNEHSKDNSSTIQTACDHLCTENSIDSIRWKKNSYSNSNTIGNGGCPSQTDPELTESVPRSAPKSDWQTHVHRKRKLSNESDENNHLKVPDSVKFMFQHRQQRWVDSPNEHGNRIRSFPHVEGNWATHVFVQVDRDERFLRFVEDLVQLMKPLPFEAFSEFHVSLSRTVTIRHHWIEALVDSLRQNLRHLNSCISDLVAVKLYTNDEKTRTFLCLELSEDDTEFVSYIKAIDKSFSEFKLPAYYENPSFHISIGWCLGDVTRKVPEDKISKAKEMLSNFIAANPELSILYIRQICCRSGNKSFVLTLQDS